MRFDAAALKMSRIWLAPFERLTETPPQIVPLAGLTALWTYVKADTFWGALCILVLCAGFDYIVGRQAAKLRPVGHPHAYNPKLAHAGAMGKLTGIVLVLLVRVLEGWLEIHGYAALGSGGIATALTVSLIAVDLQSIDHHRKSFGAAPIPVLSHILNGLQSLASSRVAFRRDPRPRRNSRVVAVRREDALPPPEES